MPTVLSVTTVRAHNGKADETVALLSKVKKVFERVGVKARIVQQMYGATPATLSLVTEHPSWADFGATQDKLASDSEMQGILAAARANPVSDIVLRQISVEMDI
ncbi:hypothetical protein [Phenylobacterium sp.]|uniref:hypothetical protein n=1 Tax=Phenylobacterium sp. TaxID=1871053 RepID=UPI0011FA1525|nr:hypothetical protein [Phenylobacterium sp.]TAL32566.1 MAG: hypothetical protein EPN98_13445 [Phenylobacterium sp.]